MSMGGLEGDELKRGLRELVTSWEHIIRDAGSLDQADDTLLHLEENDENFHKHEFIKALKKKLEDTLSPLIDNELERYSTGGHVDSGSQESLVTQITDLIIQSKPYNELKKRLGRNVGEAVEYLLANFESEFGVGRSGLEGEDLRRTPLVTDDEEGSVMIFNQDYLKSIANMLNKTQPLQTRREAMQKLNQIIPGEIVQNRHWSHLRKNLLEAMADPEEQLSELCLKFIAKSFNSTSHHTSQVFMLLVEFLSGQFRSQDSIVPPIRDGLNCTDKTTARLLKAFRLMLEFQQEAPNYWVRFPQSFLRELVESSLSLYVNQQQMPQPVYLSPLHFVSILDPKAQWFIKWMHGNYSRKILLELLKNYKSLIVSSVRHCLNFANSRHNPITIDGMVDITNTLSQVNIGETNDKRLYYTFYELEYAYFMHSLSFLGRLLAFTKGRSYFPIRIEENNATSFSLNVSIGQLLKALMQLVVDPNCSGNQHPRRNERRQYEAATLVTEVFKSLCNTEELCTICVCHDDIINALMTPIIQYLDGASDQPLPGESTLIQVADILSVLASSSKGRRHLLYGEGKNIFTRTNSSAAHLVAEFTKKALMNDLGKSCPPPANTVIGAYLYVCRQLYNTYEGLLVLFPYKLHNCVADVWKVLQASEKRSGSSVVSSHKGGEEGVKYKESFINSWKETLQDNLLNFASTCKGILLLQQTGAFNECVRYMCWRYDKKLQVSKCEKFGYGYLVTQVAATAPGIQALQNTGYLKALLVELWSALECSPQDTPMFSPKSWPVDPIDRASQKHFIRLVNILSAFPAVYELLKGEPMPSKETYSLRDIPDSIMALVDRIVFVNSVSKAHSLFNYEQSYMFGLRVLSVMVSCLDTYLLLQSQYKFQEFLLEQQAASKLEDGDKFIWDALSVERNYILVKTFLIGGPTERALPPRTLEMDKSGNDRLPVLFSSYPIPREYQPNVAGRSAIKQENELTKFLGSSKPEKKADVWLNKCRTILHKIMTSKADQLKGNVLLTLLEQSVSHMSQVQTESVFHLFDFPGTSAIKNFKLSPLQLLGIKVAVRYGIHVKVINTSSECTENLTYLMKLTGSFLKQQQRSMDTTLRFLEGTYPGFDWFTATIFLIFNGNVDRTWSFLHHFSTLCSSGYMWMSRLHASLLPASLKASGIPPVFSSTAHNIELLLQIELPLIVSAFKMSGYTPSQICLHWLTQCFWNYLDWLDIVHYTVVCIVLGVDYQVYICLAILKHLQHGILSHMQTQDLVIFLKEEAIFDFHIVDHIKYMEELESKYRKTVLPDMMNISRP